MTRPRYAAALASMLAPALALTLAHQAARAAVLPIRAIDAWSRPAAAGLRTGVAYLTLVNGGPAPDRLEAASSPKAAQVGLHRSAMSHGVMDMEPVTGGLALPPGHAVALAPNGYHLMLTGLKGGLQAGERYPLTLRFAHAKPMTIQVRVRSGPDPMAAMTRH